MDKSVSARVIAEAWASSLFGVEAVAAARHPGRGDLTAFKSHMWGRYEHADHLDLLDRKLEQVARYVESGGQEGIGRLIISMPPRHGKTMTVSKLFPAWFLGRNSSRRVMLVSYGQSLANKNSRAARNFVASPFFREVFPAVRLAEDSAAVSEWEMAGTAGEGGVSALGIDGASTGKGAHVLIVDDPHKGRSEAESLTMRDRVWHAFQGDLIDRLEPGGAIIIMMTRWHQDDLTARALNRMAGEGWEVVNLPALAEEGDVLGREPGAALWPARYPAGVLVQRRESAGDYEFSAKYQGRPRPAEGGILKKGWFRPYVRVLPGATKRVRYWDLAMSEKETADYTVGLRLALGGDGEWYIDDVVREQVELHALPGLLKDTILSDGPTVRQGVEKAGYMTRALQDVAKDPQLARHTIQGYEVDRDKLTRALPMAARAALGVIHVVVGPGGLTLGRADALVDELGSFPSGANDDQVDALAGAYMMINEPERKAPSAEVSSYA